jgi:hypothetical protein
VKYKAEVHDKQSELLEPEHVRQFELHDKQVDVVELA